MMPEIGSSRPAFMAVYDQITRMLDDVSVGDQHHDEQAITTAACIYMLLWEIHYSAEVRAFLKPQIRLKRSRTSDAKLIALYCDHLIETKPEAFRPAILTYKSEIIAAIQVLMSGGSNRRPALKLLIDKINAQGGLSGCHRIIMADFTGEIAMRKQEKREALAAQHGVPLEKLDDALAAIEETRVQAARQDALAAMASRGPVVIEPLDLPDGLYVAHDGRLVRLHDEDDGLVMDALLHLEEIKLRRHLYPRKKIGSYIRV